MIFDIIHPRNPDLKVVTFRQPHEGSYDACDLIDLLWDCGFQRMGPCLANHDGYENAVELSTKVEDYLGAQKSNQHKGN